jgi:S-adenosyl methyltransferase
MSHVESPGRGELASFDTAVPHPARVYNFWLDGKDHFESDRAVAAKVIEQRPQVVDGAVANRQFLGRAVRYLARCYGVRQFIDIGSGLPAPDNTHEVAQLVDPYSRVLYVDNDPLVMTHALALLESADEGSCDYLQADLRDTEYILKQARRTLDFNLPIVVLLLAVLHFIDDKDDPAGIVTALVGPLPAGSSVVISHLTADFAPEAVSGGVAAYNALVPTAICPRTHSQVTELFGGLSLVPPGVVPVSEWRPDEVATQVNDVYAGIARKRARRTW